MISMMILEERGYSSNHDGEDWQRSRWLFLMVIIVRIFYHKDEETGLCWYWWLIAQGKHDIVHTIHIWSYIQIKMSIILMTVKKCSTPKKDAIDLSFDGIQAHAFSFFINVIIIMIITIHRVLFLAVPPDFQYLKLKSSYTNQPKLIFQDIFIYLLVEYFFSFWSWKWGGTVKKSTLYIYDIQYT